MPKRLSTLFFILSLVFIFPGCATLKGPTVNHIDKRTFLPPQEMLEKIDRNHQSPGALKAIAHIEVNTIKGRYPLKAAVMVKRPSSLRLEVLPLIGPPELILSVHQNILKVFLPQKGEFYIGQALGKNLGHFFPFSIEGLLIEDITSLLFGAHPEIKEKSLTLKDSPEDGFYRLDILSEQRKIQSLLIDNENSKLVRVNLFDNDNSLRYSIKFLGHTMIENFTIPEKITFASSDDANPYIIIRYSDTQIATGADAGSFDLQPPLNVTTIYLD